MNVQQIQAKKEKVKEIIKDGFMEINGTEYKFTKFRHKDRLQVFAYSQRLSSGTSTVGDSAWQNIEELINRKLTVKDMLISKTSDYWEGKSNDYMTVMMYAISVIIFPFLPGETTN